MPFFLKRIVPVYWLLASCMLLCLSDVAFAQKSKTKSPGFGLDLGDSLSATPFEYQSSFEVEEGGQRGRVMVSVTSHLLDHPSCIRPCTHSNQSNFTQRSTCRSFYARPFVRSFSQRNRLGRPTLRIASRRGHLDRPRRIRATHFRRATAN
jgi:hypothetical protein